MSDKLKLETVRVIRYLRPYESFNVHNLGGVTFVFDLDYVRRTVSVLFSVCAIDENFEKSTGLQVALDAGVVRVFNLDSFRVVADRFGGFVDAYLSFITNGEMAVPLERREKFLFRYLEENKMFPH